MPPFVVEHAHQIIFGLLWVPFVIMAAIHSRATATPRSSQ